MGQRTTFGRVLDGSYRDLKTLKRRVQKAKYAKKRIKMCGGGYKGSRKEFRGTVVKFWKPYGVVPKRYWYTLYCNRDGHYDPRYIPDTIWYGKIFPYFNNIILKNSYTDKGFYHTFFGDLRQPETVVKNVAGHFYDSNMRLISKEDAIEKCLQEKHWVIKASTNTGGGRSVEFYDVEGKEFRKKVEELFTRYQCNFIVQKLVEQHPDLARIHPQSLNTVRVQSFFFKDKVHILSAQLRMGNGDSRKDNVSSGGCACAIKPDGWLEDKAVTRKSEWTDHHASGIYFKDIRVPSYDKILEIIRQKHSQFPYLGIIGWDFAVDKEGEPVFIEINGTPEPNQIASGPTFGDLTKEVLQEVFIDKTMKDIFVI